ncbi:MAG: peptidase S8 [Chloroflexi bacterium]|nr:MAG: peptidase S8 [Chloroflexota bacterium]
MPKFIAVRKAPPVAAQTLDRLSIEDKRHTFVQTAPEQTVADDLQGAGLRQVHRVNSLPPLDHTFQEFDYVGAYVVQTTSPAVAERAMEILDPDHIIVPNLPLSLPQARLSRRYRRWPLTSPTWPEESGIRLARQEGLTGAGVLVGILDTGCDADHIELRRKRIDFRYVPLEPTRQGLRSCRGFDVDGHGTHVAGIVAGERVGVAPAVELMVASVIESENLRTSLERIIHALDWMLSKFRLEENLAKPTIINLSLGFRPEWLVDVQIERVFVGVQRIITTLADLEVLPVVAVGNDGPGSVRAPAYFNESLSVGAVDFALEPAAFSGGGISPITLMPEPDVAGYGVDIFSCLEREIDGRSIFATMSGTSMAAPYVTGIAALVAQSDPCMRVLDLRQCLLEQALRIDAPRERVGAGLARFAPS